MKVHSEAPAITGYIWLPQSLTYCRDKDPSPSLDTRACTSSPSQRRISPPERRSTTSRNGLTKEHHGICLKPIPIPHFLGSNTYAWYYTCAINKKDLENHEPLGGHCHISPQCTEILEAFRAFLYQAPILNLCCVRQDAQCTIRSSLQSTRSSLFEQVSGCVQWL